MFIASNMHGGNHISQAHSKNKGQEWLSRKGYNIIYLFLMPLKGLAKQRETQTKARKPVM